MNKSFVGMQPNLLIYSLPLVFWWRLHRVQRAQPTPYEPQSCWDLCKGRQFSIREPWETITHIGLFPFQSTAPNPICGGIVRQVSETGSQVTDLRLCLNYHACPALLVLESGSIQFQKAVAFSSSCSCTPGINIAQVLPRGASWPMEHRKAVL